MDDMMQYAVNEMLAQFNRETAQVKMLQVAVESCPDLQLDLSRHKYMAGIYKTMADEMAGPRAVILRSAAWRAVRCPSCVARSDAS